MSPQEPTSGRRSWATRRWHADHAQIYPTALELYDDVPRLFRENVLTGHVPDRPLLDPEDTVVALGSCFAQELREALETAAFSAGSFWIPSGLNNTFAILDFVSWCVAGEGTARGYRYERDAEGEIVEWTPESERQTYLQHVRDAGAFVFTLGLAEVWADRDTGAVFWRGVPERIFEEERHVFRRSDPDENAENIRRTIELVRSVNPRAPIVLTLSPVPLQASFRNISCVSADAVSKSVLRVAIDDVMTERLEGVYYWPSFELVRWVGAALDWRSYQGDARHANRYLVYCILAAFVESFYGEQAARDFTRRLDGSKFPSRRPHRGRTAVARLRRMPRKTIARFRRAPGRARRELARLGRR